MFMPKWLAIGILVMLILAAIALTEEAWNVPPVRSHGPKCPDGCPSIRDLMKTPPAKEDGSAKLQPDKKHSAPIEPVLPWWLWRGVQRFTA